MSLLRTLFSGAAVLAAAAGPASAEDPIDRLEERLVFTDAQGSVAARLSGSLDLEAYRYSLPAPGLLYAESPALFNPRLSLFLDSQLGPRVYAFVQTRVDRGFDPGDGRLRLRADEFAIRVSCAEKGLLNVQAGKFATVVGAWVARHNSWDNPFVTAPLAYEQLTGVWDTMAAPQPSVLLRWAHVLAGAYPGEGGKEEKELRLPLIWGPSYAEGISFSGRLSRLDYAFEVKNAALSSRPDSWDLGGEAWRHPSFGGRLVFRPDPAWRFGFSASSGPYLRPGAVLPDATHGPGAYRELLLGQDLGYAHHHLELQAEVFEVRFENPRIGPAEVLSYHLEARYRFAPRLLGALRWNQQLYSRIDDGYGSSVPWGKDRWRLDLAPSFRLSAHFQLKLQCSLGRAGGPEPAWEHLEALQATLRF